MPEAHPVDEGPVLGDHMGPLGLLREFGYWFSSCGGSLK